MLSMKNFSAPQAIKEATAKVRILKPIYVGGEAREIGATVTMALAEAKLLTNSVPPAVEIL